MLASYLEWHLRQKLTPLLFDDTYKEAAEATWESVVSKAQRSSAVIRKRTIGVAPNGLKVHNFPTLLAEPATLVRNTNVTAAAPNLRLTVFNQADQDPATDFRVLLEVRLLPVSQD